MDTGGIAVKQKNNAGSIMYGKLMGITYYSPWSLKKTVKVK